MADDLTLTAQTKEGKYRELLPQVEALLSAETDAVANMANLCAALKQAMDFFWVGFYLVKENELVLGPFQGPVACTRIQKGRGVCGAAWDRHETIIVEDVDQFPGHIACSSLSKSEIVIPLFDKQQRCTGVLDVDSDTLSSFDKTDELWLKKMLALLNR